MADEFAGLPTWSEPLSAGQAPTAEKALLAELLQDPRSITDVSAIVTPEHFYDTRFGGIYRGVLAMHAAEQPIDAITVAGRFFEWGIRGVDVADLHRWTMGYPGTGYPNALAEQIRDAGMMRAALAVTQRLQQAEQTREPGTIIANTISDLSAIAAGAGSTRRALTLEELLAVDTTHDWLIPGLLERQDRLMLTGLEGLGKSTLLQQIAFATAAGVHPFNEHRPIQARRVLFVDAENSERQWSRKAAMLLRRLERHAQLLHQNVRVHHDLSLRITDAATVGQIHRLIDEHQPDLLVIGPIYRIAGGSLNDEDIAASVLAALDTFRARGLALLMEAHAGKSQTLGGDRNLAPRGSSALLGWPEFGLGLRNTNPGDMQECELVSWRGAREEREWPTEILRNMLPTGMPWKDRNSFDTPGGPAWMP